MFERAPDVRAIALLCAVACCAVPAASQAGAQPLRLGTSVSESQEIRNLRQRADSLIALREEAVRTLRQYSSEDSARKWAPLANDASVAEIRVGVLRVVADTALASVAKDASEQAWTALQKVFGSELRELDGESWTLRAVLDTLQSGTVMQDGRIVRTGVVRVGWDPVGEGPVSVSIALRSRKKLTREVAAVWFSRVDRFMLERRQGPTGRWARGLLGREFTNSTVLSGVYRDLTLGDNRLGRACLQGDLRACERALTGAESQTASSFRFGAASISLLRDALETGGADAYGRFVSDTVRSIPQSLVDASRLPLDSLISRWQARVAASRPKPASAPPGLALTALLWTTVLCVISLRSSRWR